MFEQLIFAYRQMKCGSVAADNQALFHVVHLQSITNESQSIETAFLISWACVCVSAVSQLLSVLFGDTFLTMLLNVTLQ